MEAEYKREMNRNYMVLCPEPGRADRYTIRMMSGNQIAGLLPFREKWVDGENRYYFDITSKQPLGRLLEYRTMTGEEVYSFLSGFLHAIKQIERFLLDENQICLDPYCLYVEPESFQCALLMIPGRYEDFIYGFRTLCGYLLDHVNRNDGDAVLLAFSVFKESQKENFGIEDIAGCLEKMGKHDSGEECGTAVIQESPVIPDIPAGDEEKEIVMPEEKQQIPKVTGVILGLMMFLIPIMMIFIGGWDFLFRFKLYLIGSEVLLGIGVVTTINRDKEQSEDVVPKTNVTALPEAIPVWKEASEECFQTVLLAAKPVGGRYRYLVPAGGGEEIPIRYFPFLIGKNKGIVDFYLNENGISRLHAKLEEIDGVYYVTDLNSTNGIMVDGVWLEANERKELLVGSELILAASRFYFR